MSKKKKRTGQTARPKARPIIWTPKIAGRKLAERQKTGRQVNESWPKTGRKLAEMAESWPLTEGYFGQSASSLATVAFPTVRTKNKKYVIKEHTKWRGFSFGAYVLQQLARLLIVFINGSNSHHLPSVFVVKSLCCTMPGLLFAGATLAALVGVLLPLLASYFFGGQITLYLSSPYGFRDIPDQTGALDAPHLPFYFTCVFSDAEIEQRSLACRELIPD